MGERAEFVCVGEGGGTGREALSHSDKRKTDSEMFLAYWRGYKEDVARTEQMKIDEVKVRDLSIWGQGMDK